MRSVKSDRECSQFDQELAAPDSLRTKARDAVSWARPDPSRPAGRVVELRGIIFQSDSHSFIGAWLIRPVQMFDRRLAGLRQSAFGPSFAMHVGLHVVIADGKEFVVEQLLDVPRANLLLHQIHSG